MASVINPDAGLLIVKGNANINGTLSATDGTVNLDKTRIDSGSDINLNNIPASYVDADAALNVQGGAWIGGNLYTAGTLVANGDIITLGNSGGSLTLNSNISSDILPSQTNTYNVGNTSNQWQSVQTGKLAINAQPDEISSTSHTETTSLCKVTLNTPSTVSLGDGTEGQVLVVACTDTIVDPVVVTPDNSEGFSNFVFTNVGETVTLIFINSKWFVTSNYRATISL